MNAQSTLIAVLLDRLREAGFHGDCQIHFSPTGQPGAIHLKQVVSLADLARGGVTVIRSDAHGGAQHQGSTKR